MEEATTFLLPADMVLEILARVDDVAALFRCATTCKVWRRLLIADPSFLHRCLSEKACRTSPFTGFFAQLQCDDRGAPAPCLVSAPRSVLGPGLRFLGSFFPGLDDPGFFDDAVPLISRHGLLLLRLNVQQPRGVHLAVCNVLAGTFQVLPCIKSLSLHSLEDTGYALVTSTDCSSLNDDHQKQLPSFKVFVIGIWEYTREYHLRTYLSTSEHTWNMSYGSIENSDIHVSFRQPNAALCGGVAHWLLWGSSSLYTLEVSAKTSHVSFAKLPAKLHELYYRVGFDEPYLSVDTEEERLTVIYLQKEYLRLEFWTWNDNGSWITDRVVELKQLDHQNTEAGSVLYWCMAEKNGTVLLGNYQCVCVVDFKTDVMREITDWPRNYHDLFRSHLSRKTFIPLEMDWPAYFVSRLGIAK